MLFSIPLQLIIKGEKYERLTFTFPFVHHQSHDTLFLWSFPLSSFSITNEMRELNKGKEEKATERRHEFWVVYFVLFKYKRTVRSLTFVTFK